MTTFLGEIRLWAGTYVPEGWVACDGRELSIQDYGSLYELLGSAFGGSERTFRLPDLRGRVPVSKGTLEQASSYVMGSKGGEERVRLVPRESPSHRHQLFAADDGRDRTQPGGAFPAKGPRVFGRGGADLLMAASAVAESGAGEGHENRQPYLALKAIMAIKGKDPSAPRRSDWGERADSHEARGALVGEVKAFPYSKGEVPQGWFACDGRTLPSRSYMMLYSVIRETYGGGSFQFRLPDLRGRVALGVGQADEDSSAYALGDKGGEREVKLAARHNAKHTHELVAGSIGGSADPALRRWASGPSAYVNPPANLTAFHPEVVEPVGGAAHPNEMPYLGLTYGICHAGLFPMSG